MKVYHPYLWLNLPRWLESIIKLLSFLFMLYFINLLKFDEYIFKSAYSFNGNWIFFFTIVFFLYRNLTTFSAVDEIIIDYNNKLVTINYWLFHIVKREIVIKFDELAYKNRNDIFLYLGGSLALLIYKNGNLKIKLNSKNGWIDQQIDMLTDDLLAIKQPLRPLVKRKSIGD